MSALPCGRGAFLSENENLESETSPRGLSFQEGACVYARTCVCVCVSDSVLPKLFPLFQMLTASEVSHVDEVAGAGWGLAGLTVLDEVGIWERRGWGYDVEHGSYNLKEGWVTDSCLLLCSGPDNLVQVVFTLFLPKSMPRGSIIPEAYFPSGNANDHSNLSIFV